MTKLTKRTVDTAPIKATDYFVWDSEIKGFGLRVLKSGVKSYLIQYRSGGRTRRLTLGKHGVLTPDEARKMAREYLVEVANGGNPSEDRRRYSIAPTLSALCSRFMDEHVKAKCKPSTTKEYQRNIDLFIKPTLGNHKIQDITRQDIAKLHHANRHIPYQANRTLGVLSKLFNLAEEWGLRPDGSNPTRHVKKYHEEKRERYLSAEELKALGKALQASRDDGSESPYMVAAIKLLILTGCRLGEIQTLKWDYIRGNALFLPDSKTGAKKVYLGQPALDVLADIERLEGNPYVICGKKPDHYLTDFQKPWRRIRERAKLPDLRIHDLRHSFASGAVSMGESLPMIGKLLGHSQVQTTARYAHLADAPMHEAADRVSEAISAALAGNIDTDETEAE
ncbi:tyrosine-type recombinase/integrase [Kordiimonas marina]|uniref:tyrosine-type recombinase/integrase n=1 Tax=Kordiimonas marina TaxID=2872312 RepID=UPI001FF6493F|nr:site-specific integrase [Kordiimonas marina]MCJ9430755.1 tyrosine-type recombinase/integrase [Kordiimonas marina]